MKRVRITRSVHVGTNTPDGKGQVGRFTELERKFNDLTITEEELREYATFLAIGRRVEKKGLQVSIFGKVTDITSDEWENIYKPAGFSLL